MTAVSPHTLSLVAPATQSWQRFSSRGPRIQARTLNRATTSFHTIRLVASKPVFDAAAVVHGALNDAAHGKIANLSSFMPQFNKDAAANGLNEKRVRYTGLTHGGNVGAGVGHAVNMQ